jgi:hypothetical protein
VISSPVNDPESGGEAEYNEPRERRMGGPRKGPEATASSNRSSPQESENDGRGKSH